MNRETDKEKETVCKHALFIGMSCHITIKTVQFYLFQIQYFK
jgi:hypothetical protein